jgi:hypothetical protein
VTALGFESHVSAIITACSKESCDTILFSPWTVKAIKETVLFPPLTAHNTVVLGVGRDFPKSSEVLQVWVRGNSAPTRVKTNFCAVVRFSPSKRSLVKELPERIWGKTALIVCGESNILKVPRGSKSANRRNARARAT